MDHYSEVESLKKQIAEKYKPKMIYLFGSCAHRIVRKNSDIDLCIVMDYEDKKEILADINMSLESDIPFDILLYSTAVWNENVSKEGSFANKIFKEGRMIYG